MKEKCKVFFFRSISFGLILTIYMEDSMSTNSKKKPAFENIDLTPRTRWELAKDILLKSVTATACLGTAVYCAEQAQKELSKTSKSTKDYAKTGGYLAGYAASLMTGAFATASAMTDGAYLVSYEGEDNNAPAKKPVTKKKTVRKKASSRKKAA